jgi:hypothetical protein
MRLQSFSTCRQILLEKSIPQRVEMRAGDAVAAVRIFHETELLVQIDKLVEESLRALEMNVVIAGAMDDQ